MPVPEFKPLIKIRCDFPLEVGFVDEIRNRPREDYDKALASLDKKTRESLSAVSYEWYAAQWAAYQHPRYMAYLIVLPAADDQNSMAVFDGYHMRLANYEGLFTDLLNRLAHAMKVKDPMKLPLFPERPDCPMQTGYPKQFMLHDTETGDLGLYPWAHKKYYLAMSYPPDPRYA